MCEVPLGSIEVKASLVMGLSEVFIDRWILCRQLKAIAIKSFCSADDEDIFV